MKSFIKILSLAKKYKYRMLFAAFIGFLTIGSSVGLMMTSAYLIASAALQVQIHQLQAAIVGVRFFGISRGVFRYLERLISHETTFKLLAQFRYRFFESFAKVVPFKSINFSSGDLLSRAVEDIEKLEHIFVRVVSPPIVAFFTLALMFGLLSIYNISYSIQFSVFYIVAAAGVSLFSYLSNKKSGAKIIRLKSRLSGQTVDILQGMQEIIIFGAANDMINEISETENELLNEEKKLLSLQGLNEGLIGLMMNLAVAGFLISAVPDVTNNLLNPVSMVVIILGIMSAFEALLPLPVAAQFFNQSIKAGNRLLEISDLSDQMRPKEILSQKINDFSVEFSQVNFSYPGGGRVLNNLNIKFPENSFNALIGPTGAGKTTLINLLIDFWQPDSGDILIGGKNIKNVADDELRNIISVVPQKIDLFTGSIKENLLIGKPDASPSEIESVLEKAKLNNFVSNLPKKLDTEIGELGKILSGGERKRLALARALLRDSKILICDEITTGLDPVAEKQIFKLLADISHSKTVIMITHRFVSMEKFDNIFLLSGGKIQESGRHNQLAINNKLYSKFLACQNERID